MKDSDVKSIPSGWVAYDPPSPPNISVPKDEAKRIYAAAWRE